MNTTLIQLAYLAAAVLFILGLRNLSSPKTASRGNAMAAVGMLIAVVATLLDQDVVSFGVIIAGVVVGSVLGAILALRIAMTAMPQMVALLNGLGGAASVLVASGELVNAIVGETPVPTGIVPIAIVASVLIGSITLTGSLVAFAKLQELVGGGAVTYPGQQVVNAIIGLGVLGLAAGLVIDPLNVPLLLGLVGVGLLLGVLLVIPIGGADMPVVISLLNSYSGSRPARPASCSTTALVISGALVGASGLILTKIMCDAMNRSLANVLFGGFGAASAAGRQRRGRDAQRQGLHADDAAVIFSNAAR